MKRTAALLATAALALAACGGSDSGGDGDGTVPEAVEEQQKASKSGGGDEGEGFPGSCTPRMATSPTCVQANTYKTAKFICKEPALRELAKDLGLSPSSDELTVAEEYSQRSNDAHRAAAFEGCLAGLGVP